MPGEPDRSLPDLLPGQDLLGTLPFVLWGLTLISVELPAVLAQIGWVRSVSNGLILALVLGLPGTLTLAWL